MSSPPAPPFRLSMDLRPLIRSLPPPPLIESRGLLPMSLLLPSLPVRVPARAAPPTATSATSMSAASSTARLPTIAATLSGRREHPRSLFACILQPRADARIPQMGDFSRGVPGSGVCRGCQELLEGDGAFVERPSYHHADDAVEHGERRHVGRAPDAPAGDGRHEAGDGRGLLQRRPALGAIAGYVGVEHRRHA